jgi:hypothetical protein
VIGEHVAERQPAAGAQHAGEFGNGALLVSERAKRALAQRGVERGVGERQRLGVPAFEPDAVAEARRVRLRLGRADRLRRVIDARREAAELTRGEDRRFAAARGDVQQSLARARLDQLQRPTGRPLTAGMELAAEQPPNRGAGVSRRAGLLQVNRDSSLLSCSR